MDTFGSDGFMESCNPKDFEEKTRNEDDNLTDDVSESEDSGYIYHLCCRVHP